jgi:hypothetical protein
MTEHPPKTNTDPPVVRCGMCGGRCRRDATGWAWIECRSGCAWSSHDRRRTGPIWQLRVWVGR